MAMFGIGQSFKRIQNTRTKKVLIVLAVKEAIKKHVGVDISEGDIVVRSNWVALNNTNQSLRSAIYIKKERMLEEINSKQGFRIISDIR